MATAKNVKTKTAAPLPESPDKKSLFIALSVIAIIVSFVYSYKLKWLGDDIFIVFRYVQNMIAGNGVVYNKGEHVEGYTDFLWVIMITSLAWLKFSPLVTTQAMGILSSIGTLIFVSAIGYKISKKNKVFIIPFITIALAVNYDYNVWATSGLETSFYTFLLTGSFYTFFFSDFNETKKLIVTGLLLTLALMTRPDALLIIFIAELLLFANYLWNKVPFAKIIRLLVLFNAAFILIYIPYFMWRYHYFGFIFPNTYYDKLGSETLFSKGFYYIWLYFKPHFLSFLIVLLPPFALLPLLKGKVLSNFKTFISDKWNAAFIVSIMMVYAYLLGFVAKVGGDFMHARFIIPTTPFMYYIIFYSLFKFVAHKNLNIVLVVLLLGSILETNIRFDVFKGTDKNGQEIITLNRDVADERWAYVTYLPIENEMKLGKMLNRSFEGIDAKLLIRGGQACMGYFANFNYEQEFHGLTDTLIAHSEVKTRGRIGHEKHGSTEYFEGKGINFMFNRSVLTKDTFRYAQLNVPPYQVRCEILTYDNAIMAQVKAKLGDQFLYTDFTAFLDDYIRRKLPVMPKETLKKDYDNFYLYYFKHNDDKERENKFLDALK